MFLFQAAHMACNLLSHRCVNNGTPLARRFTNVALEARELGYENVWQLKHAVAATIRDYVPRARRASVTPAR